MKGITKLSVEQLLFINSYVEHRDLRQAVIDSGYTDGSTFDGERHRVGKTWLEDPLVAEEIDRRLRTNAMAASITQAQILDELRKVAFFDPRNLFNEDGSMKNLHELDNDEAAAISHFEVVTTSEGGLVTKMVPSPKIKALELLGKNKQMFVDRVEHSAKGKSFFAMSWIDADKDDGEKAEEAGSDE